MSYRLIIHEDLAARIRRIACEQLEGALCEIAAVTAGDEAAALPATRKHNKKTRAFFERLCSGATLHPIAAVMIGHLPNLANERATDMAAEHQFSRQLPAGKKKPRPSELLLDGLRATPYEPRHVSIDSWPFFGSLSVGRLCDFSSVSRNTLFRWRAVCRFRRREFRPGPE